MISESKLRELLHDNVPESSILDFKRDLYRLDKMPDKESEEYLRSAFIKDILAMANTPREEASYIVIGVTANPNGTKTLVGVPGDHPDDAMLQQILNLAKVQPQPEFSYQAIRLDGLSYGVIEIPLQNQGPYIPTKDYGRLESSHLYFRRSSMNEDASPHQQNEIYEWFISRRVAAKYASSYQQAVPFAPTGAPQRHNRMMMLNRVRSYRIKGVLDHPLSGIPLILGLHEHSDMVTGSLYREVDEEGHPIRKLSLGTPMLQVYTDANGELLILGESGSGKTTLLLELTRDLLDRATHDETHPIPVVFNLSSWALKRQPLQLWLVEELKREYMVPHKQAVYWVENDQILPLLDGLDEVAAVHRENCIEEINTYHREHGLVPLVVSCRSADYNTLQTRLQLYSTVTVQPLKTEQIDDYLTAAGEQANALRLALEKDSILQDLATTPLMLNILRQAYQDKQIEDLISTDAPDAQRHRILADYVQRKLQQKQKGKQTHYQHPQMAHWLGWLAQQLALRSQTEFSIERIQPDWLSEQQGRHIYDLLGVRLPGVLFGIAVSPIVWISASNINYSIFNIKITNTLYYILLLMLISGLIGGLFSENAPRQRFVHSLIPAFIAGVLTTCVAALISYKASFPWDQAFSRGSFLGLGSFLLVILALNGFVGRVNTEIRQASIASGSLKALWTPLLKAGHLRNGIVVGLIYGLAFWLDNPPGLQLDYRGIIGSLVFGLLLGISSIILSVILGGRERTVQPVEVLAWSWSDFRRSLTNLKHLRTAVLIGAILGLACRLGAELDPWQDTILHKEWLYALNYGLAVGLSYWLFVALLQGVSGTILDEHLRIVPNQGIRRSMRNGLFMGLIGTCVSGVFAFLAVLLPNVLSVPQPGYQNDALIVALIVGLAGGLILGLLNGWLAYIRHRVLRALLSRAGVIPANYTKFLEEAAARSLLHRVGSSYRFIHQMLLDYFAKQEIEKSKDPIFVDS